MQPFQTNQPLHKYSTFGIGGNARYFVCVESVERLQEVLKSCKHEQIPFHPLGKGSNSLFDDRGFDGLVIQNKISFLRFEGSLVSVGAGYSFALLGVKTASKGFSGLEFASGIPASVGGAIFMNAGASGAETASVLESIDFVDEWGQLHRLCRDELSFSYRYSCLHKRKGVIACAQFQLTKDEGARERQLQMIAKRIETQPYGALSCGCVFRNPSGKSAGHLIEVCGLKGMKRGGACVSSHHANFIINETGASAEDVWVLAQHVKECVKRATGIELEMELRRIPYQNHEFSS